MIRVLYKQPGRMVRTMLIQNDLKRFQALVGGYIETVGVLKDVVMIVNEEGKIKGMEPNFLYGFDLIVGPAIFCRVDRDKLASLTEEQAEAVKILIKEGAL